MSTPSQPLNFSDTTPAAPSGSVNIKWQADAPGAPTDPPRNQSGYVTFLYDTVIYFPPVQTKTNQEFFRKQCRHTEIFAGNFAGSGGSVDSSTAATSSTTFTVKKNGSAVGTIVWGAGSTTPTFTTTSGAAITFNSGDVITIVGPSTADATLASWGATLVSTRS